MAKIRTKLDERTFMKVDEANGVKIVANIRK
jgi:hypothetical protein